MSYTHWIGKVVAKDSGKPFKCGKKEVTVKDVINHPILAVPAFIFIEDNSYVECRQCHLV